MPASLSLIRNINLKSIKLIILLLLSPLFFFAQTLTGLWIGTISNDSTTVRKDQSFEIALTEYKGKVYGYSRSEFIVDDVLYYVMKRVKGTIEGDVCEVKDDEIISFNFPRKIDKGVKVTSTFYRNKNDGVWYLAGTWKTSQTKNYYAVTGKVDLQEEKDLTASKIFPHLEELKLADDVAFYKDRKEGQPIVKIAKPEKINTDLSLKKAALSNNTDAVVVSNKPTLQKEEAKTLPGESSPATVKTTTLKDQAVIPSSNEKNTALVKIEPKEEPPVTKETATVSAKADLKNVAITTTPVTTTPQQTISENKKSEAVASLTKPDGKDIAITTDPVISTTAAQTIQEDKKTEANISSAKPDTKNVTATTKPVIATVATNKPNTIAVTDPPVEKKDIKTEPIAKTTVKQEPPVTKTQQSTITKQPDVVQKKPETNSVVVTNPITKTSTTPIKTETISTTTKRDAIVKTSPVIEKKDPKTETGITPLVPEIKRPDADVTLKAALISGRKSEFSQVVNFKSDSLELSLYDNGEIDGDTVTIFMNGEVILAKQGLKASAIKKTIYITPGNEDFTLVMFAENLGRYPPNTGLLVVHDGDDVYNLRFSADLQRNAGIVFRRKK